MKISVIVATYNSEKYLSRTLESILSQNFDNYEVLVVDGNSTDSTVDIIKEYQQKFGGKLRWISEKDNGIYDAMNKGVNLSTGEVVGFLNSDDLYASPDVLSTIASAMSNVDCVFGNLDFVLPEDISRVIRIWRSTPYYKGAFRKGWHPAHPTFYARKECYEKFGGYIDTLAVSADFELMLRFLERYQISSKFIPETLVKMSIGGESTGSIKKIFLGNKNIRKAFKINGIKPQAFYTLRRLFPKIINRLKHW